MSKSSKFKLLTIFCFTSVIVLGVYVLLSTQYSYTDAIHPIYGSAYDSAVAILEQNQNLMESIQHKESNLLACDFDSNYTVTITEEAINNVFGYEHASVLQYYSYAEIISGKYTPLSSTSDTTEYILL